MPGLLALNKIYNKQEEQRRNQLLEYLRHAILGQDQKYSGSVRIRVRVRVRVRP